MLHNLTSIKEVIGRVIRNTRIQDTSYIADMKEWIPEAIGYMKTRMSLVARKAPVDIHFHSGMIPCGLHTLTGVYFKGQRMTLRSNQCGNWYDTSPGLIQTSICDGTIEIHFLGLPLDSDGFPLIPDNEDYKQAIYYYVRQMMIGAGFDDRQLKYDDCMNLFEKHAARAMGQIRYPSVDMMSSRIPSITRFLPDNYAAYFGLHTDGCGGGSGLDAFGIDLTVNGGGIGGGGNAGGGTTVITNTVVEHVIDTILKNAVNFRYLADGTEGNSIILKELIGHDILELFLNSYLLDEEKNISIAITPNTFRFDKSIGRLTFYNDFSAETPPQIVQGLYTTEV